MLSALPELSLLGIESFSCLSQSNLFHFVKNASLHTGVVRAKATGEAVEESWEKMSKSKLNGVDPAEVVSRHGLELTRLTMLSNVGPHSARQWNEGESMFTLQ